MTHRIPGVWVVLIPILQTACFAGSYDLGSMMRLRDVIPGTEQAHIIVGGDFEGDWAKAGWHKKEGRWGRFEVARHVVPAPGVCGKTAVHMCVEPGSGSHEINVLPAYQPHWKQTFSGYIWLPGPEPSGTAPGVPGAQHVCWSRPLNPQCDVSGYAEGAYLFGDWTPSSGYQIDPAKKQSYNIKGGSVESARLQHKYGFRDGEGKWRSVILTGDNLADTPIIDFAPPVLRHAAAWDFSNMLSRRAAESAEQINAQAAEHMVDFARNLRYTSLQAALAAWKQSLEVKPNQPHVRHWLRVYRGYALPLPYEPPNPPRDLPEPPRQDPEHLKNDLATYLRVRDIMPGTERVTLIANGDFEAGLDSWRILKDNEGLSVASVDQLLTRAENAGPLFGTVMYCEAPLKTGRTVAVSAPVSLEAGKEYVISAYITPLCDRSDSKGNCIEGLTIGFSDGPRLYWGWPIRHHWTSQEGLFVFIPVQGTESGGNKPIEITASSWMGDRAVASIQDKQGRSHDACMLIDNVAVTPADRFRPPVLRNTAQFEFRALVELDRNTPARVLALLKGINTDEYIRAIDALSNEQKDPGAFNRLAAARMVEFLRVPSKSNLLQQALADWKASLEMVPDQPNIERLVSLWEKCEPAPWLRWHVYGAVRNRE